MLTKPSGQLQSQINDKSTVAYRQVLKMLTKLMTTLWCIAAQIRSHKLYKRLSVAFVHAKLTEQRESNLNQETQSGFRLNKTARSINWTFVFNPRSNASMTSTLTYEYIMPERIQLTYKDTNINSTYFSGSYKPTKIIKLNYSWQDGTCVHIVAIIGKYVTFQIRPMWVLPGTYMIVTVIKNYLLFETTKFSLINGITPSCIDLLIPSQIAHSIVAFFIIIRTRIAIIQSAWPVGYFLLLLVFPRKSIFLF
jgi:hypothetical protein